MDSVITVMQIEKMESDLDAMSQLRTYEEDIAFTHKQLNTYKNLFWEYLKNRRISQLPAALSSIVLQQLDVQRRKSARLKFIRDYEPTKKRSRTL